MVLRNIGINVYANLLQTLIGEGGGGVMFEITETPISIICFPLLFSRIILFPKHKSEILDYHTNYTQIVYLLDHLQSNIELQVTF